MKYDKNDKLEVEVISDVAGYVIASALRPHDDGAILRFGEKVTLELLGHEYDQLVKDLEDDMETWEAAKKWEDKEYQKVVKDYCQQESKSEDSLTAEERKGLRSHTVLNFRSATRKFYLDTGRSKRPLRHVSIKKNNGPHVSVAARIQMDQSNELKQLIQSIAQASQDSAQSNKELILELAKALKGK
jgi:hypothetical protein